MVTELSTEAVEALFAQCLAGPDDPSIVIEGVVTKAAFSPQAIGAHREEIGALLAELPEQFQEAHGGGWSFLNACDDRHGRQWTSFHRSMEQLFMLGMASGQVKELLPRDMWSALPGNMPYYVVCPLSHQADRRTGSQEAPVRRSCLRRFSEEVGGRS